MTLLLLTVIPLSVLILVPLGRKMYKISKALQDETASFTSVLTQVLSEIRLVKSSNTEKREYETGNKGIEKLLQFGLKREKVQALISPVMSFVLMALLVIIVGYGGMRVSSGCINNWGISSVYFIFSSNYNADESIIYVLYTIPKGNWCNGKN